MKKIYLSLVAIAAVSVASAQQLATDFARAPKNTSFSSAKTTPASTTAPKAIIWTNDCSNAADWTVSNTSTPATDWFWTTDPAAMPSGAGPATMTTATNGYWLIDSDSQGQAGVQDAYVTWNGGAIDCSGQTNLTLEFETAYRTYLDTREVDVSGDGGATWTTLVVTDGSEASDNFNYTYSADITSLAGSANVALRFHYIGAWGWDWAVDDIVIKTTEPYDLRADELFWGVDGTWGVTLPYYNTPIEQIQPITFCGSATNTGLNNVTDATFTATVGAWTGSGVMSLNGLGGVDTVCTSTQYTPAAAVGSVNATFDIQTPSNTDANLANNDYEGATLGITDYSYARDNVAAGTQGGTFNSGNGYETGNVFDMFTSATLTGIEVGVHPAAVEGASMFGKLYSIDPTTGDFILEDQTDYYTITAADIGGAPVLLPLLSGGYTLAADETYLIVAGSDGDGGLSNDFVVGTSGSSAPQTTFYYDATDLTWYYSTTTKEVRMYFGPLNVNELENNIGMNVFPNPAVNNATVSFELNGEAAVNVSVTDLAGQVVYTNNLGSVAGAQNVEINTTSIASGVYMVNVEANGVVSTEKLVVRK